VVITNQVSYNLIVVLASKQGGGLTAYQTAYQFFQLPYALLAVSIASAIMPDLAERWAAQQWTAFLSRVIRGLRVTLALLIPAAVGYAFVAGPTIELALRHFHVTAASAHLIGRTLPVFALGLPGFSAFLLLVRALQAMKDTRTMFFLYAGENALTVVLAVALYHRFGDRGLAAAFIGPYTLAALAAAWYLHARVGALGGVYTARSIARTVIASATMALVLWGVGRLLPAGDGDAVLVLRVGADVVAGSLVYLGMARWLHIDDLQPLLRPARAVLVRVGLVRAAAD
jgi:putative peptidoglycan lipid II flippase